MSRNCSCRLITSTVERSLSPIIPTTNFSAKKIIPTKDGKQVPQVVSRNILADTDRLKLVRSSVVKVFGKHTIPDYNFPWHTAKATEAVSF